MKITKSDLKNLIKICDTNNPKYELNFIYIDAENAVCTNTRALALYKHGIQNIKPFYIHQSIVKEALRNTKAVSYTFDTHNCITAYDKEDFELMQYSMTSNKYFIDNFNYPDYKRIIPEETKINKPFVVKEQIHGILANNEIAMNPKYLPDFDSGIVGINKEDIPVTVTNKDKNFMYVSMPTIENTFKELRELIKGNK